MREEKRGLRGRRSKLLGVCEEGQSMCRSPKALQKNWCQQDGRCERHTRKERTPACGIPCLLSTDLSRNLLMLKHFITQSVGDYPNLDKVVSFCVKLGIAEKPERVHALAQPIAAFLSLSHPLPRASLYPPFPTAEQEHTLPFTARLGIAASSQGLDLRNTQQTWATTSCVSCQSRPKCPRHPQNNANVQEAAQCLLSRVPCGQCQLPAGTVPQPLGSRGRAAAGSGPPVQTGRR